MEKVLLVKYGEIILRGKNRKLIENILIDNIFKNIKNVGNYWVSKEQGRFLIESREDDKSFDYDKIIPLVTNVLGVSAVCKAIKLSENSIENIKQHSLTFMRQHIGEKETSFKVETKRSIKEYPLTSKEISIEVGGYLFDNIKNLNVNVHNPEVTLNIEIRNFTYIYCDLIKGFGGLPVGTAGKATALLSGGIDSPVATFMIAKRGVEVEAVYFNSPPYTSDRAKQKVMDIAENLAKITGTFKLYIVPFTQLQLKIYENVPGEKMTIFLKRAMLKIAEKIAIKSGSLGLITGDSVGQVASQTMQAMNCISSAINNLEIYRPLCGMDKQEIIDIARKIGTYDISIRPFEDCCTIFVAKHPETKPKKDIIEKIEKKLEWLDKEIEKCLNNLEIIEY